jgi:flavin-dependent dehydrogenase
MGVRRRSSSELIALEGLAEGGKLLPGTTIVESTSLGWWYVAQTDVQVTILLVTTPTRSVEERAEAWRRSSLECIEVRKATGCIPKQGSSIHLASSSWLEQPCGAGWAAVGDAALACDPLAGGGLEIAVETAAQLRDAYFQQEPDPARYHKNILERIANYRIARNRVYRYGAPATQTAFWISQVKL